MMRAMPLFWDRGYEGTSIADLVSAMGITPPALYSAYGSKEELYRELLDLYISERAGFDPTLYFGERTTHETLSRILREAANAFTAPNHPKGCMISTAALANAPEHSEIAAHLATLRNAMRKALEGRLEAARAAGDLPEHADPTAFRIPATRSGDIGQSATMSALVVPGNAVKRSTSSCRRQSSPTCAVVMKRGPANTGAASEDVMPVHQPSAS